jgi:dihydrofolate synthase / folylpolyglutamate synthase
MSASWPARMQRLRQGELLKLAPMGAEIWLDGGHNPGAGIVVAEALAGQDERSERPLFMIAGMINTKDSTGYFRTFEGLVKHVYAVPVSGSEAGVAPEKLALAAQDAGLSAEPVASVANALALLRDNFDPDETPPRILIGGSLYLAGEVLRQNGTIPE